MQCACAAALGAPESRTARRVSAGPGPARCGPVHPGHVTGPSVSLGPWTFWRQRAWEHKSKRLNMTVRAARAAIGWPRILLSPAAKGYHRPPGGGRGTAIKIREWLPGHDEHPTKTRNLQQYMPVLYATSRPGQAAAGGPAGSPMDKTSQALVRQHITLPLK